MPIFDDELLSSGVGETPTPYYKPKTTLASPNTREVNTEMYFGGGDQNVKTKTGLSLDQLSELGSSPNPATFDSPFQMVPRSELLANKKYAMYERDKDLENIYGINQSWASSLGNGIIKMGAFAAGTFAQGFASMPNTIRAMKNGSLQELSNPTGYESDIDNWLKNIEDVFPNYYTRHEKEHPWLSAIPGFAGSANFWGDKIIKNIGFTVGAIGSAVVQDAGIALVSEGIGEIPLVSSQIGKAALYLNKIFTSETKLGLALGATEKGVLGSVLEAEKLAGATSQELLTTKKLAELAASKRVGTQARYLLNIYGSSRTEAAVEARDGYRQVKETLINDYKVNHLGEDPTPEDLKEIDDFAINSMNARFGLNMALLTVSNSIQFDNILKPYSSASSKEIMGSLSHTIEETGAIGLKKGSLDTFEKKVATTFKGKVWESVKPKLPTIFSEGVLEEGGQFAVEKGTYDYYTRKYKDPNKGKNQETWNDLNEVLHSTAHGLKEQFGGQEGIENMLVGAMSAIITGGLMSKIESFRGNGKDKRLQTAINVANQYGLTGILQDKYGDTVDAIGIAKEMKEAVASKNIYKYKNLQHDMFFNFVKSRIPAGLHDVTIEQLKMLKELEKPEFEKMFGIDFNTSNKTTVNEYVDELISNADSIKKSVDALDKTFTNPYKLIMDPKTDEDNINNVYYNSFNEWKTDLAYFSSVNKDRNERLASIQRNVMKVSPLITNNTLQKMSSRLSLRELANEYENQANQLQSTITENTSAEDRRSTKQNMKSLRTYSERINLMLNTGDDIDLHTFNDVLNFELNNRNKYTDEIVSFEHAADLYQSGIDINEINQDKKKAKNATTYLTSEKGFNTYMKDRLELSQKTIQDKTKPVVPETAPTFVNDEKEAQSIEVGREYEIDKTKGAAVRKIADDRYQVIDADGNKTFYSTKEEAQIAAQDTTNDKSNLRKVKVLAINPDSTIKIEDVNGDIMNIDPSRLKGYRSLLTEQEKLQKDKETIRKQQDKYGADSGTVITPDTSVIELDSEPALKDEKKLFVSTTTEGESFEDPALSPPHIKRSRLFLNNLKNFENYKDLKIIFVTNKHEKALGLEGLTALSYGENDTTDVNNTDSGFIAAVFVVQEKGDSYFVDVEGKKIGKVGEKVDLDKVIFQTMPTTSLTYNRVGKDGKPIPRYRSNQEEGAIKASKGWAAYRKKLFSLSLKQMPAPMPFIVSRGIKITTPGTKQRNSVGDLLVPEKVITDTKGLVVISTDGKLSHNGELISVVSGVPCIQYRDTFEYLNNKLFSPEEAKALFEVIKKLADDTLKQSQQGKQISFNPAYMSFLQNVLFWKKGKTVSPNQIRFNEDSLTIDIGAKSYALSDIADKKEEIINHFTTCYNSVNNTTLKAKFNEKFKEFYIDKAGNLSYKEWDNYQTYLLSSTDPDGKKRSPENTPLTTLIAKPTSEGVPYTHKAKYATVMGIEFPVQPTQKQQSQKSSTKTTVNQGVKYKHDGTSTYIYDSPKYGKIPFSVKEDGTPWFTQAHQNSTEFKEASAKVVAAIEEQLEAQGLPKKDKDTLRKEANFLIETLITREIQDDLKASTSKPATGFDYNGGINVYNSPRYGNIAFYIEKDGSIKIDNTHPDWEATRNNIVIEIQNAYPGIDAKLATEQANTLLVEIAKKAIKEEQEASASAQQQEETVESTEEETTPEENNEEEDNSENDNDDSEIDTSDDGEYRFVGANDTLFERMTDEDEEIFKAWVAEKLPAIPYEILKHMITTNEGEKAWGVFEDNVVKFVKGGLRGTEYHEVMEAVWKGMLTIEEREAILAEERTREGEFLDRVSGKKYRYNDPFVTDKMLKERIMDDFSEFRLGKLPAKSLSERVLRFFKTIINFFKTLGKKSSLKEELFKAIEKGEFREKPLAKSYTVWHASDKKIDKFIAENTTGYFATEKGGSPKAIFFTGEKAPEASFLSQRQYHQKFALYMNNPLVVDTKEGYSREKESFKDLVNRALDNGHDGVIVKNVDDNGFNGDIYISLDSKKVTPFSEYKAVDQLNDEQTHYVVQDMVARAAGILFSEARKELLFSPERITSQEMFKQIEDKYIFEKRRVLFSDKAWEELQQKTKDYLRTLGITFDLEDKVELNTDENNKNDYATETFSVDWKKNSTGPLKFLLATLLKTAAVSQEDAFSLKLPEAAKSTIKIKGKTVRGYQLVNFSQTFATLLDKLSNTTKVSKAVDKLLEVTKYDTNYVRLADRLLGSKDFVDYSKFKTNDWRLFIQFIQTFTKQKPEAIVQYISQGNYRNGAANLFSVVSQTQRSWLENLKTLAKEEGNLVTIDKVKKVYKIRSFKGIAEQLPNGKWRTLSPYGEYKNMPNEETAKEEAKSLDIKRNTATDMTKFLGELGIEFPMSVYTKLTLDQKNIFAQNVSSIYSYLGSNNEIMSLSGDTLEIGGPLSTLADLYVRVTNPNQDSTFLGVEGQRMGAFADNNAASVFENIFNESETIEELKQAIPHLNDIFSAGSEVLRPGGKFFNRNGKRIKTIKVKHILGTKNVDKDKASVSTKLNRGDRFMQEINQNINGDYYILMPADGSTEWMMNLGNSISFSDIKSDLAWNSIYKIFNRYLIDDVNLALDASNRDHLYNLKNNAKELRFFSNVLFSEQLNAINTLIEEGKPEAEIKSYITKNQSKINESIKDYIEESVANTRKILEDNQKINVYKEGIYSFKSLNENFLKDNSFNKDKINTEDIDSILTYANVNYIINNIEYHKILFGDPFQFAIKNGILDETKRLKSFLSPRRTTFDTPEYNNFLNEEMNKVGNITLKAGDPGFHTYKEYTDTVTLADNNIAGSLSNLIKAYGNTDESDGMSWLMDGTYKEIMLKNGQWSDQAEAFHQWQMAWTRQNLPAENYTYTSEDLRKHDKALISKPMPKYKLSVLKPIVSGNKYNKTQFDLVLDKFSQMPIYYSMVKGKNMEKLYLQMMKEKRGYAIVKSGRKVGVEETHNLYNADGSFNETAFNNNIQVPWTSYGIQVETSSSGEKSQTRGSQITKIASIDLFDNGVPTSKEAQQEYERNTNLLNEMHRNAYNQLLKNLGITDLGYTYEMKNGKSVSETLMHEMMRRELSDNAKDTIQVDENNMFAIPFEASPSYVEIRSIIYSMIHKALNSPSMHGGAHVQVPVTMFEKLGENRRLAIQNTDGFWEEISQEKFKTLSSDEQKKVRITDDTLKFYEDKDGRRNCEILVPHWFKDMFGNLNDTQILEYLNSPEGEKILTGIGFRIPTQSLSSVEVFRVKGFLPQYMGATVVVPSEITTKAGSDFDIDKLNMYLKSVYVDVNGKVRLVRLIDNSEQKTKEFYGNIYEDTINKEIAKIEKFDEFRDNLFKFLATQEHEFLPLTEEQEDFYDFHKTLIEAVTEQAEEAGQKPSEYILEQIKRFAGEKAKLSAKLFSDILKEKYVDDMYKKALENEYYDSLEKLVTLPENFNRLVNPVGDAGLKDLAKRLNTLRGNKESAIKNKILDRNYMTNLRHSFTLAKNWVGVVAVSITNLSLKQKSSVFIDPTMLKNIPEQDKNFIGDASIILDHNIVQVEGKDYISLSGTKVKDSDEFISERYSGYASAVVDVAKDDYITSIIQSDLVVGVFMFLENIGAGEQGIMFMNQPIISEYLNLLDNKGSRWLFTQSNIDAVKSKFVTTQEKINMASIDTRIKALEGNISQYYNTKEGLSEEKNAEQIKILDEFLKYAKMAEYNFKFTQSTNYDTTKFGSGDELTRKQWRTAQALSSNIISSVQNILDNTFIGKQEFYLSKAMDAMGKIFKLEESQFRAITDSVLKYYGDSSYISADKFNKIALQVKTSFLDYIIQTKIGLNDKIKELLVDSETSVASRLEKAKKDYPELQILKDLEVVSSPRFDGTTSIKLKVNLKEAYDENLYTGMMRSLRDYNDDLRSLYDDIILLSMLQGTYQSSISIKNIIPIEDYSAIVEPIITPLVADGDLEAFTQSMFQRNNFKDTDVVGRFEPTFFIETQNFGNARIEVAPVMDENQNLIYSYVSPNFANIPSLGVSNASRKVLLLSDQYNSFDLKNDYLVIPRVIRQHDDNIDMLTGKTIAAREFILRKLKGDFSLNDVYGYKKVRTSTGEPLVYTVTRKGKIVNNYVYKQINLLGDGFLASEYYNSYKKSVLNNGTRKIENEIEDEALINFYGGEITKNDISEIAETAPIERVGPTIFESRNNPLEYTPGQEKALTDIASIIDANKQAIYLLAGYAGTGKTTLAENIAKYAMAGGREVVVMAPTNAAVKVLNNKLKASGVEVKASTIHKAIYGEPDPITKQWIPGKEKKDSVIIIDESSMIDKNLMQDLIDNTRNNNIIIFMGDGFQLEQIGKDSGLFKSLADPSIFEKNYSVKLNNSTQLTEVKRQTLDSNILKLATLTRTDDKAFMPTESIEDFKVVHTKTNFINDFKEAIANGENVAAIVATNTERMSMNQIARTEKFGPDSEIINPGEALISVANSSTYANSEVFNVENVDDEPSKHTLTFEFDNKKVTYDCYLYNLTNSDGYQLRVLHFPTLDRPSLYHADVLKAMQDSNKELYNIFEDASEIITNRKGVKKLSPEIVISTYGYAITGHKSQGSQWDRVFVNQNFVASGWNPARWYYTAITRAASSVEVLTNAINTRLTPADIETKINSISQETSTSSQQQGIVKPNVDITKSNYTRQEVQNNPNTAYIFTENTHSITAFPDRAGGGSAVIRGLDNAFAIVTKKKYDYNTRENVDYTDTPENFKEFVDINTKLINDLKNSGKSKIVFPQGFATDKAEMPTRFAEWLQKALLDNFGLVTELNATKTGLISKSVTPQQQNISVNEEKTNNTSKAGYLFVPINERVSERYKSILINPKTNNSVDTKTLLSLAKKRVNDTLFNEKNYFDKDGEYDRKKLEKDFGTKVAGYIIEEGISDSWNMTFQDLDILGRAGVKGIEILIDFSDEWLAEPANITFEEYVERMLETNKEFVDKNQTNLFDQDREIKVDQYTFTVKSDGSMFYRDGKELTDQTIKNKVNVRKELQDGTLRVSTYNKSNYFVLLDGRIVGSGTTNLGKESITDPKIKEQILAKAIIYKKKC